MRGCLLSAVACVILAFGTALPAEAVSRKAAKAYDRGEAAAKSGDWAAARQAFEEALQIDDKEGRFKIGVTFTEYFPSLGLAEAAIELGDLDAARAALDRFDMVKKTSDSAKATASSLRGRLSGGARPSGPSTPSGAGGPAPEATAAKRALDEGDLAGARRLAKSVPTDELAQQVLAAVDALLAEKLTAARRDQDAGALGAARAKLESVVAADPQNSAAKTLLESVRADESSAGALLSDARAALGAGRYDQAEDLARQARSRDASLADEVRALEREISSSRRSTPPASGGAKPTRRADAGKILAGARSDLDAGKLAQARRKAGDALAADAGMAAEVKAVQSAIAKQAGEADDSLRRARSAVSGGRFAAARKLADQAKRLDRGIESDAAAVRAGADEGEAKAQRLLAKIEAHVESGASESARSAVAELAGAFPEHPELASLQAQVEGSGDLVAGMRAYFRGDWAASIESLTPLLETHPERSDLLAVLGCAHATRGLLLGSEDAGGEADLTLAGELFARSLAANPDMKLDPRFFSPRIRGLFDQARGS